MKEEIKPENLRIHSRADELIACLEGEIAKRDAELAACRVAVENCELFRARIAELESQFDGESIVCGSYRDERDAALAELSAIKAQGVVMPEPVKCAECGEPTACGKILCEEHCYAQPVARLNAAPVQQVSVPTWMASSRAFADRLYMAGWRDHADAQHSGAAGMYDELLAAAPASPAADAGLVDMYRHLQKVTPYRFKKIQDASITDGGDVMYFHKDRFDAALLADMAAHSANGVV